jgi:hypothetical protein
LAAPQDEWSRASNELPIRDVHKANGAGHLTKEAVQ